MARLGMDGQIRTGLIASDSGNRSPFDPIGLGPNRRPPPILFLTLIWTSATRFAVKGRKTRFPIHGGAALRFTAKRRFTDTSSVGASRRSTLIWRARPWARSLHS